CPPGSRLLASSGLFVASRLPLVDRSFTPYAHASGSERFARKGILHVRLGGPGGGIELFATHLQAHPEGAAVRRKQLAQARAFVERRVGIECAHPILLGGDLNVIGEHPGGPTEEYREMRD